MANNDSDTVDDIHGFFQFAQLSDSDNEDGLFGKTRDRTVAFDASKINYTPKIDQDSWYDHSKTKPVSDWLSEHFGLDEITFTAQRHYSKQRYAEAMDLCRQTALAFIERYRDSLRLAAIREILEIGCRSAMRLDSPEDVGFFYDIFSQCGGMNPGYNRFMAEALAKMQRYEEALEQLVLYLVQRKQDAKIWEMIGLALSDIGQTDEKFQGNAEYFAFWQRLAVGAYCKSRSIIDGCRTWAQTDIAVKQKKIQCQDLRRNVLNAMNLITNLGASRTRLLVDSVCSAEEHFWQKCKD
ncbi:hypothetical protein LPJ56_002991, partial [Coemansia sp. RSA 2599]